MNKIYLYKNNKIDIPHYHSMQYDNVQTLDNKSIESFYIIDILDHYTKDEGSEILTTLHSKLIDNGELISQGPDFKQLITAINFNKVNFEYCKNIIYVGILYMHQMENIISNIQIKGFICKVKEYMNIFEYYLEFTKI